MQINISDLHFGYPEHLIFDNFNLTVRPGEILAVVGPSGCGKSTLLKLILNLLHPVGGTIHAGVGENYSVMLSESVLFPWKSVLENLTLVGEEQVAMDYLSQMQLDKWHDYYPGALSAGMKQRVLMARMAMIPSKVWLLDEPFNGLDEKSKEITQRFLKEHQKGKTIIFVTHNLNEILHFADRALLWNPETRKPDLVLESSKDWEKELRRFYFDAILDGRLLC